MKQLPTQKEPGTKAKPSHATPSRKLAARKKAASGRTMKLLPTQSVCAAHQMNWPTICRVV